MDYLCDAAISKQHIWIPLFSIITWSSGHSDMLLFLFAQVCASIWFVCSLFWCSFVPRATYQNPHQRKIARAMLLIRSAFVATFKQTTKQSERNYKPTCKSACELKCDLIENAKEFLCTITNDYQTGSILSTLIYIRPVILVRLTAVFWIGIIVASRPNDQHFKQFVISYEEAIKFKRYGRNIAQTLNDFVNCVSHWSFESGIESR